MIKTVIQGIPAIIQDGKWTTKNDSLTGLLNSMIDPAGPSGADPYPDMTTAKDAIEKLGGKIIEADEPDKFPPGTII